MKQRKEMVLIAENCIKECISWACKNPQKSDITKWQKTNSKKNKAERKWGQAIISSKSKNWTGILGERLVFTLLNKLGKNPIKPKIIAGFSPDIETDDAIYEVKTRNWTTSGTAGEKVYGVPFKYASVPRLYNKPLIIICLAYQEYEMLSSNNKSPIFNITAETHSEQYELIQYYKSKKISFMKFSDLVTEYKTLNQLENLTL
jgi:hypothetical protein